uniref:Putative transfer protein n=1 Tax=Streptomyces laurentii TaxID=39478 RepID=Q8GR31_STRLU|nr:transfer protein [Streptomyces laurentii]BAC21266.1 putative transfer protein [Streptomyces laurentii]
MVKQQNIQQNLPAVSSGAGTVKSWLWKQTQPFVPPWIVTGLVGVAGGGANFAWDGSPWAGIGLTLGSVALTAVTWTAGARSGRQLRLHSAITVASASAWTTAAAVSGPFSGPLGNLYLMGGGILALSWNIRRVLVAGGLVETSGTSDKGLMEKVGLARTLLKNVKVEPNKVTAAYELPAGESDQRGPRQRPRDRLASALDVPTTAIRIEHDPDSARRGRIVIVPEDMLKDPTIWPGPYAPGESVAEPLRIGVYDDGSDLLLPLLAAIHILVMGMTGSGKTEGALDLLAGAAEPARIVVVWLADAAKAGQDFQPLVPALDWAALDTPSAAAMVASVQTVIPARTAWLRDHGYRAWEPAAAERQTDRKHSCRKDGKACGCEGIAYLLAWFEEAAKLLRELGDDVFTGIAQEARSAGVTLVVSMQRASGYQLSTDTRASLPAAMCFGVKGDDASFALPEEVLDAGADPAAWGNKRKGYVYLASAGVDEDLHATPVRTYWTGPSGEYERMAEYVVTQFETIRAAIDAVTADAATKFAGKFFTDRRARAFGEAPAQGAGRILTAEQDVDQEHELVDAEDADVDPTAEILRPERTPLSPPASKPGPEEARELLDELVRMLAGMGPGTVAVKDLGPYLEQLGRDRSWVSKEMKRLAEEGLVPVLAGV